MHVGIIKYLLPAPSHDALWKTPYFSCIFQASAFWVLFTWLFKIVTGMDGWMDGFMGYGDQFTHTMQLHHTCYLPTSFSFQASLLP